MKKTNDDSYIESLKKSIQSTKKIIAIFDRLIQELPDKIETSKHLIAVDNVDITAQTKKIASLKNQSPELQKIAIDGLALLQKTKENHQTTLDIRQTRLSEAKTLKLRAEQKLDELEKDLAKYMQSQKEYLGEEL